MARYFQVEEAVASTLVDIGALVWEVFRFSRSPVIGLSSYRLISSSADAAIGSILGEEGDTAIPLSQGAAVRPDEERGAVLWVDGEHGGMGLLKTASK